jgi:hypothetical protein
MKSILAQKHANVSRTSARRIRELLRLNRNQLRQVTGLLTGYCHLKRQLNKLGLVNSPMVRDVTIKKKQPHKLYVIVGP